MNEQDVDMLRADAELYAGSHTPAGLREFALQVIELCKDHMKVASELAVLRRQTEGVIRGDRFRRAYQDMMDRGGE